VDWERKIKPALAVVSTTAVARKMGLAERSARAWAAGDRQPENPGKVARAIVQPPSSWVLFFRPVWLQGAKGVLRRQTRPFGHELLGEALSLSGASWLRRLPEMRK